MNPAMPHIAISIEEFIFLDIAEIVGVSLGTLSRYHIRMSTPPLCVDLDGTLHLVDAFHEACILLLRHHPQYVFLLPFWMVRGKAYTKHRVFSLVEEHVYHVPIHEDFLTFLRGERALGRQLILVTAAPQSFAQRIADQLGIFDAVLASTPHDNLCGCRKAEVLVSRFGLHGFDYAGNAHADRAVWNVSRRAIIVHPSPLLRARMRMFPRIDRIFLRQHSLLRVLFVAMRPHHMAKNILVFIPLFSSHLIGDVHFLMCGIIAFVSFCACTASVYLCNDLLDVQVDRAHPSKRLRPSASGALHAWLAIFATLVLTGISAIAAAQLSLVFVVSMLLYAVLATVYSLWLKKAVLFDLFILAFLYTMRIIAGNAATGISASFWLLSFSMLFFFGLACLKRCAEFSEMRDSFEALPGRGYRRGDDTLLQTLGVSASVGSTLLLGLYIESQRAMLLYEQQEFLWIIPTAVLLWVTRLWFLARRHAVKGDPILFALRDIPSYVFGIVVVIAVLCAM